MCVAYFAADFKPVALTTGKLNLRAFDSGQLDRVTFTYFERNNKPIGTRYQSDWSALCNWIEQSAWNAETKNDLPLIKLATFTNDYRNDATIETIYGVECDYDAELMQPQEALIHLTEAGIIAFIYTSPSHTPEKPRWRIIAPTSHPLPASERRDLVGRINGILGGVLASESFTESQSYYVGQLINGHPVQYFAVNGTRYIDNAINSPIITPPKTNGMSGRKPLGTDRARNYSDAVQALYSLDPNDTDYHEWRNVSFAFRHAATGFDVDDKLIKTIWDGWCGRYTVKPNTYADNDKLWRSADNGTELGWSYLRDQAIKSGNLTDDDRGWMLFGGTNYQLPAGASATPLQPLRQQLPDKLLTPFSELLKIERSRNWLIRGIVPANAAGVLYGAPGTGKTFVAIDIAASVASATKFNGRPTATGPIVYVAGEGHAAIRDRFEAWFKTNKGDDQSQWTGQSDIHISRSSISIVDQSQFHALAAELDGMPVKPKLVIIDTLFRATAGADVNDAQAMTGFWANVGAIKSRYNCTVLIVHHTGRNEPGRSFGSIVLLANADFEMSIEDSESGKAIKNTKQKDAPEFNPMHFNLKQVHLGHILHNPTDISDIEQITSCVCEFITPPVAQPNLDRDTASAINENVPRGPKAKSQRKVGGLLCAVHDQVLKHRGILPTGATVHTDILIPKDLLRKYFGIGSHEFRDGLNGLGTNKIKWITATTENEYLPKPDLLRWARDEHYSDYDNLELTPDELKALTAKE